MGLLPSQIEDIPASDHDLLVRYWIEEPWGPWRDNMHAAMIALELHRANFKGEVSLSDFMVKGPWKRAQDAAEKQVAAKRDLFAYFRTIAKKV